MEFEWDPKKAAANRRKHGVSFEEAATVFGDQGALIKPDLVHSMDEQRAHAIGFSEKGRLLVISFIGRGEAIRVISARRAGRDEAKDYGSAKDQS